MFHYDYDKGTYHPDVKKFSTQRSGTNFFDLLSPDVKLRCIGRRLWRVGALSQLAQCEPPPRRLTPVIEGWCVLLPEYPTGSGLVRILIETTGQILTGPDVGELFIPDDVLKDVTTP